MTDNFDQLWSTFKDRVREARTKSSYDISLESPTSITVARYDDPAHGGFAFVSTPYGTLTAKDMTREQFIDLGVAALKIAEQLPEANTK